MTIVKTMHDIIRLVAKAHTISGILLFAPLSDEPDIRPLVVDLPKTIPLLYTPQSHTVDPFFFAKKVMEAHKKETLLLFIPGQMFDAHGTRHGRGGGWYDRFLSQIPKHWIRIGVLHQFQLSQTILRREPWDEPMDGLLIESPQGWYIETIDEKRNGHD